MRGEGMGPRASPLLSPGRCMASAWLFLCCILYNKLVAVSKACS